MKPDPATLTLPVPFIDDVWALKRTVTHSGGKHRLEQAWRDKTHAVYKHFGECGQYIGWEVIKIKFGKPVTMFGKVYPWREVYPNTKDFGRYALSVGAQYDLEDAKAMTESLFKKKGKNE